MKHPLLKLLKPINETQNVRGVDLPIGLEFRQLVVTGPPGAGKSYYIHQIGGWPNEGYIDLTKKRWWKEQTLIYRPREIHLGIPYQRFKEALTVFDQEWLDSPAETLQIDYRRIQIIPRATTLLGTNWRDRYIFEFLIADAETIYERRRSRQREGYFPVDANLSLDVVRRQVDAYCDIALYLHRAGINVYIRKDLREPPLLITEKGAIALPPWAVPEVVPRASLSSLDGWKQLLLGRSPVPWFTVTEAIQDLAGPSRIPHDGRSLDLIIGRLHLRLSPEIPLGASKRYLRHHKNWTIRRPESCSDRVIRGFARIHPGQTVILGRANKEYGNLFDFKKEVAKRHVAITNTRGDLVIRPLDPDRPVKVVRLNDLDTREQPDNERIQALLSVRRLLGGKIEQLGRQSALSLLLEVNEILAREPYRPLDSDGMPGGVVELPPEPTPIVIGDLHANVDNLLKIISESCVLEALRQETAVLCILGDAVHSEKAQDMENMESSILIMDVILSLKRTFPRQVFYLRGNHDDFDPDLSKNGVPQGILYKKALAESRGPAYVEAMQTFYDRLPYLIVSNSFIATHAGPPRNGTTREQLVDIRRYPHIARTLTKNRLKRPHYLSGYGKGDIKSMRRCFAAHKSTPVIVGHTPLDPFNTVWRNAGGIKNHHIVSSSHQSGPGLFLRIRGTMMPLTYPAEPLVKLINKMKHSS